MGKEKENLVCSVSSQLADSSRLALFPASFDKMTRLAVNRRVASLNLARGAIVSFADATGFTPAFVDLEKPHFKIVSLSLE